MTSWPRSSASREKCAPYGPLAPVQNILRRSFLLILIVVPLCALVPVLLRLRVCGPLCAARRDSTLGCSICHGLDLCRDERTQIARRNHRKREESAAT